MKRRKFVLLSIAGCAATITPFCKNHPRTSTALNTPNLLAALCDSATIRKIGTDYRTTTTNESHESDLTALLSKDLDHNNDQTQQLDNKVKEDFTQGRTVTIEGWVLSITEARQCALYSIQLP